MANRGFDLATKSQVIYSPNFGGNLTDEIVSEILCKNSDVLSDLDLHDKTHKVKLMKRAIFSFIAIKGKHLCRNFNRENNSLKRHGKMKEVIFSHE